MTRSKCGLLLLLAAGIGACGGDPTESFRGEGEKIVTDPAVVFVDQGTSVFVVAQLQDNQGNQLATDFQAAPLGPEVTVTRDTAFLETTNGQQLKTRERFIVTGVTPGATSFELTGGSIKDTVRVNVTPTSLPATFSNAAPASNEVVTLTAPNYNFLPGTTVTIGADTAIVLSVGSELKFLPIPGSTGPVTVSGAAIGFLPETPLTLTSTEPITVAPPAPIVGTGSPATAPTIVLPDPGNTSAVVDSTPLAAATCGGNSGAPCQLYKISLPTDTSFDASLKWSNTADLGIYVMSADGSTDTDQACDDLGNAGDGGHEACTITLAAGDYLIGVVSFAPFYDPPDPEPDWVALSITLP
jgi:hypothetical protein